MPHGLSLAQARPGRGTGVWPPARGAVSALPGDLLTRPEPAWAATRPTAPHSVAAWGRSGRHSADQPAGWARSAHRVECDAGDARPECHVLGCTPFGDAGPRPR